MASKKQKTRRKSNASSKTSSKTTRKRAKPPPSVIVRTRPRRRNGAPPAATAAPRRNAAATAAVTAPRRNAAATAAEPENERIAIKDRVQEMDGSHVAMGVGAGAFGNMLGVLAVGRGWIGPKATAGILLGSGAAAATAGYVWESDHLMAAGAGLVTAGTFSLANQYAIDAYESIEERAKGKREARERKELQKRLAEARVVVEAEKKEQRTRNAAPRVVVLDAESDEAPEDHDDLHDAQEYDDAQEYEDAQEYDDDDNNNYREDIAA